MNEMSTFYRTNNLVFCLMILLLLGPSTNGQTNKSSTVPVTGRTPRSRQSLARYSTTSIRPAAAASFDRRQTSWQSSSLPIAASVSLAEHHHVQNETPSTKPTVSAAQTSPATTTHHATLPQQQRQPPRPAAVLVLAEDGDHEFRIEPEAADGAGIRSPETTSATRSSTNNRLANVVTAPMPLVPLQTIFLAAEGGEGKSACIAVKTGIRFTFSYVNVSSGKTEHGKFDLPVHNHTIVGECGQTRQRMSLIFSPDNHVTPSLAVESGIAWNLTMSFVRNESSDIFLDHISLRYVMLTGHLPFPWSVNARMTATRGQDMMFHTPDDEHSFICMSDAGYGNFVGVADDQDNFNNAMVSAAMQNKESPPPAELLLPTSQSIGDDPTFNATKAVQLDLIEFYNLQLQAFLKSEPLGSESNTKLVSFSKQVIQCSGDFISIRIPVIVGIILLVFVVSVLIIYTIRRMKRSRQTEVKGRSIDYRPVI